MLLRTFQRKPHFPCILSLIRRKGTSSVTHETDPCGIPIRPTWSVNELLSSYPSPKLSPVTINRLYELSALIPPKTGTPEHATVTKNLEEMVRLVEAVRLVDTTEVVLEGRGEKEDADRQPVSSSKSQNGQDLLQHSSRTANGFYIVDSERRR